MPAPADKKPRPLALATLGSKDPNRWRLSINGKGMNDLTLSAPSEDAAWDEVFAIVERGFVTYDKNDKPGNEYWTIFPLHAIESMSISCLDG